MVAALDGWDAQALKQIATTIAAKPGHVAILIGSPAPSPIVIARSADVAFDAGAALKQLVARFGGKGGGRPDLAQGGGLIGSPDDMVAFAARWSAWGRRPVSFQLPSAFSWWMVVRHALSRSVKARRFEARRVEPTLRLGCDDRARIGPLKVGALNIRG